MGLVIYGCGEFCEDLFIEVVVWERDVFVVFGCYKCYFVSRCLGDDVFVIDCVFVVVDFEICFIKWVVKVYMV